MALTRRARRAALLGALLVASALVPAAARAAHEGWYEDDEDIGVQVWTDRGERSVYRPGDALAVYVRVSRSSFVTVYDVDTRGRVHVLYPRNPLEERQLAGGRTYRFPRNGRSDYFIDGPPGIEYVQVVASREPMYSRLPWDREYLDDNYRDEDDRGNDDYDGEDWIYEASGDPFAWCARVNALIVGDDECAGSAYTSFYVGRVVAYPRYLCNECHVHPTVYGSYASWDPYSYSCAVFEVRVTSGWVYRGSPYRYRTCPPLFVYYRRDNCPPRWSGLQRWWSSADRNRIHAYFGATLSRPIAIQRNGRTAYEKDRDYREKPGSGSTSRFSPPPRQSSRWKDADVRERSSSKGGSAPRDDDSRFSRSRGRPTRYGDEGKDVRRGDDARPAPRRSWISELLRGAGGSRSREPRESHEAREPRESSRGRSESSRGRGESVQQDHPRERGSSGGKVERGESRGRGRSDDAPGRSGGSARAKDGDRRDK